MELHELGYLLNNAVNMNIRNMGELSLPDHNRPGVFSAIKKRLKWILWIFTIVTLLFAPYFINLQGSGLMTLFLYFILSIESIISLIALSRIRSIEHSTGNVSQNLLSRIRDIKLIFHSYTYLNLFFYVLLLAFLEYSMYHKLDPNFNGFFKVELPIRLTLYMLFILFQYYIKKRAFQKKYGSYLNKMISILEQVRE